MNNNTQPISLYDSNKQWFKVKRYYALNHSSFEMDPHIHNEFEIMYAAHGKCQVFCIDANRNNGCNIVVNKDTSSSNSIIKDDFILKEGEYILIDCNVPHQLVISRGTPCRVLNLEIALCQDKSLITMDTLRNQSLSVENFLHHPVPYYKASDTNGSLHSIITALQKQLKDISDIKENQIQSNLLLAQFMIELSRQRFIGNNKKSGNIYVQRSLSFCEEYFDGEITIDDIATAIGISNAHLQRCFKESTGLTIIEYINQLRIEKAKLLLETSILPVVDVALNVGFNNRQHFTHTFIKYAGCSPATYRKRKGNQTFWEGFSL